MRITDHIFLLLFGKDCSFSLSIIQSYFLKQKGWSIDKESSVSNSQCFYAVRETLCLVLIRAKNSTAKVSGGSINWVSFLFPFLGLNIVTYVANGILIGFPNRPRSRTIFSPGLCSAQEQVLWSDEQKSQLSHVGSHVWKKFQMCQVWESAFTSTCPQTESHWNQISLANVDKDLGGD